MRDEEKRPVAWTVLERSTGSGVTWYLGHDLASRPGTAANLRHIEARYRMLVEHGRDMVAVHDPDGRFRYVSPAAQAMVGYRADELVGTNPYDFYHPGDGDRVQRESHRQVLAGQANVTVRYRFRRKDGSYAWLETIAVPLFEDAEDERRVTSLLTASRDVSTDVEAAERLETSEERLRLAMLTTGIGVYDIFPQLPAGHHFSDEYLRILGYGPEDRELFVRGWEPLVHPDDTAQMQRIRQEIPLGRRQQYDVEFRRMHRDGRYRWLRNVGRVVKTDSQGRALRVVGTLQDIDERKRSERALADSHARLARAQELAHLGDWNSPVSEDDSRWSAETFRILGLSPATVTPSFETFLDRVHPEDRELLRRARRGAVREGTEFAFDSRIVRPDGSMRYVHHQTRVARDAYGRVCSIDGTIQDVTERKQVEEALRTATAELEYAQQLARIGSWKWSPADDVAQWSPALYEVFGLDAASPPPGLEELGRLLAPESRRRHQAAVEAAVELGRPYEVELEVVRPDGTQRWVLGKGEAERGADGRVTRLVGTAQDITERKRIEIELRKTRDEVRELARHFEEERDQERKRIAMDVHDEVGQLLTAMKHEIHLLQSHAGDVAALERGLRRLEDLADNSIEVTRNVALNLRPPALDLGLAAALEWLAEDFELRSEIPCDVHARGQGSALDDRQAIALFRIATESLTNIARHAGARRARIDLDGATGRLTMTIRDDGRGFDLEAAREQGHFGLLGMNERAWRIGATLTIDSRPGQGTSVRVQLPATPAGSP